MPKAKVSKLTRQVDQTLFGDYCVECRLANTVVRVLHPGLDTQWTVAVGPNAALKHAYDSQSSDPYHLRFRRELDWARVINDDPLSRKSLSHLPTTVYLAHPVSGDFEGNIRSAHQWLAYLRSLKLTDLRSLSPNLAHLKSKPYICAPWLGGAEPDGSPDNRQHLMSGCRKVAASFDEVWAVVSLSPGVREEAISATRFVDLTGLKLPGNWGKRLYGGR